MKLFQFGVWSISYKPLHETSRNKTNCGGYFIALNLTEIGFCYMQTLPRNEIHNRGFTHANISKNHRQRVKRLKTGMKFHFTSPAIKTDVY